MKKWKKISLISLGIFVLIFLLGNFGINIWLKYKLPDFLKKNTNYIVNYKTLNVELSTGNIFATHISVKNKNTGNQNSIGLYGSIDTLKVSRFGILDALFKKKINSSDFFLANPNLQIFLAKPANKNSDEVKSPVMFKNITIKNGNIDIFRYNKQAFLSVKNLQLQVSGLQLTEESVKNKLPIVFDDYSISGNQFYFRPNNIYSLVLSNIQTQNGRMKIENFKLVPLLSFEDFQHFYPEKSSLFDFSASSLEFKDFVLKKDKISLSKVDFQNPNLKIYTGNAKQEEKKQDFEYEINLDDVSLNNSKIEVLKPNKTRLLYAGKLNLNVVKFKMNNETAKGNIPFSYEKFQILGEETEYASATQDVKVGNFSINQNTGDLKKISIMPTQFSKSETRAELSVSQISFGLNNWKLENNKLKIDAKYFLINQLNGTFFAKDSNAKKEQDFSGIEFPLTLKNLTIKNSNFSYNKNGNPLQFNDLNASFNTIEMNEKTVKNSIPFNVESYELSCKNFEKRSLVYNFKIGFIDLKNNDLQINNFSMIPLVSRHQFIKMNKYSKDLYTIKANQISMKGSWKLFSKNKMMNVSQVVINEANANIYESYELPSDPAEKFFFNKQLREIDFPMFIDKIYLKNSFLSFEEGNEAGTGAGKLVFSDINAEIQNVNSAKMSGKPTLVKILMKSNFMKTSPMSANWSFDTKNANDAFAISGNVDNLPANNLNAFVEPYLNIKTRGNVQNLFFDFKGDKYELNGEMKMKHQNLTVSVLRKDKKKNVLLSAIANMVVRTNSKNFPESVVVDHVKHEKNKSFFHLFWEGLKEGLQKTLISKNIEKTQQQVQNTKKTINKTAIELEKGVENITQPQEKKEAKKEGFFKKIFKKKEKAGN